jgi:hypothetical protein
MSCNDIGLNAVSEILHQNTYFTEHKQRACEECKIKGELKKRL